jgi:hypothetical protein
MNIKKIIFLMLTLFVWGAAGMNAQVTVGSDASPQDGAILDLSKVSDQQLGFLLPRVSLTGTSGWQLRGSSTDGAGMLVYNINPDIVDGNGVGIYLWDGVSTWQSLKSNLAAAVNVVDFTITPYSSSAVEIWDQESQVFTVSNFSPNNASYQAVTWEIATGNDVIELINPGVTGCTVKGLKPGSAQIVVTSVDGKKSKSLNIKVNEIAVTGFSLDKSKLTLNTSATPVSGTITVQNFVYSHGSGKSATVTWSIEGTKPADTNVSFNGNTYTVTPGATDTGTFTVRATIGTISQTCEVTIQSCPSGVINGGSFTRTTGTRYYTTYNASDWTSNGNLCVAPTDQSKHTVWPTNNPCPDGFRMPNLRELINIYDQWGTGSQPAGVTAMASNIYWSSTESSGSSAWLVYFVHGSSTDHPKTNTYYLRCVRSM